MKQNKKGNVAVIAIIIVIVAVTAGTIGFMFGKKFQTSLLQKTPKNQSAETASQQPIREEVQNYKNENQIAKENNDGIKTCDAQEFLDGTWKDTNNNYIKIGAVSESKECIFNNNTIRGGAIVELQSSEDNINWRKVNYWSGENGDLYRFKNCINVKSGSELSLEVSKDNGKTWVMDYDGSWMAYNTNGESKFCKFSLGTARSLWAEADCAR